jgi:arylsulfatase A-like enzyme
LYIENGPYIASLRAIVHSYICHHLHSPALESGVRGGVAGPLRCGKASTWEGGLRVPGIAWWLGKISHRRSAQLSSTLDLLPTIFNFVGVALPQDRVIDGVDMAPILFKKGAKANREFFAYFPEYVTEGIGPFAVRWKKYKAHYYTSGGDCPNTYPDVVCRSNATLSRHYPPLLFNLHMDPQELYPLDPTQYGDVIDTIDELRYEFLSKMEWNEAQTLVGKDRSIQPCATPGCSPFPYCCRANILQPQQDRSFPGL